VTLKERTYGGKAPESLGGSPVSLHLYVEDVDAFVTKAVEAERGSVGVTGIPPADVDSKRCRSTH
jgi:uncharacterized glyoxalase superfamily protein PhnB